MDDNRCNALFQAKELSHVGACEHERARGVPASSVFLNCTSVSLR